MTVCTFTVPEFEAALPHGKQDGRPLCQSLGCLRGEHSWLMKIDDQTAILIRSSIGPSGFSRSAGEDSIRAWLVETPDLRPLGSKVQRWVTRQPGWEVRLVEMLRTLWAWRRDSGNCLECGQPNLVFRNHNSKEIFTRCRVNAHRGVLDSHGYRIGSKTISKS